MSNELEQQFQNQQIMSGNMQGGSVMQMSTASREMEEVKGQIFMAKQFPRNVFQAQKRIQDACKRQTLAESALYSYPRGGQNVTGPSIRLAEVLAQNWGNVSFGFKELSQSDGESTVMAYAWDVETNTRQERIFQQPHSRKAHGRVQMLTDPRDIYELIANQSSRRVRACILSIIPGDIVEDAINECNKTLSGNNKTPFKDRMARCLDAFKENFDVTQEQIEQRFAYGVDEFSEKNLLELVKIFNSLKDNMSKPTDWFEKREASESANQEKSDDPVADEFKKSQETKSDDATKKTARKTTRKATTKSKEGVSDDTKQSTIFDETDQG